MGSMIRSMPLFVFLVMVAFPLAMAGVVIFAGVQARRRAALVKATPTSYIATAEPGYRQFEGRIEAVDGKMVTAPLTKAPCVWYHARVEQLTGEGGSRDRSIWTVVRDVTSDAPFLIRDDAGVAVVHPYGAEIFPTDKSGWFGKTRVPEDRDPPRVPPTENPFGMIEIAGGARRFKYFEERIYAGDPLLVQGYFVRTGATRDDEDEEEELEDDEVDRIDEGGVAQNDGTLWGEDDADDVGAREAADDRDAEALSAELSDRAAQSVRAAITRGSGKQPFVLTTTPRSSHVELSEKGGLAAVGVAIVPLALAGLLLWTRWG